MLGRLLAALRDQIALSEAANRHCTCPVGMMGPMTQRELSQALRCTPGNVTDLVDALEAAGLVARGPHPTDRRATLVSLTERGQAAAARMQAEYRQFAAELFRGVPAAELASFVKVVDHALGRLREADPAAQGS